MRTLIRGGKPPHVPLSPEAALARWGWGVFGGNVGNTLFLQSVYRAINTPHNDVKVDSLYIEQNREPAKLAQQINESFDMYVLPLANAFRPEFSRSLTNLTEVIERLNIPTVVTGVGGQAKIGSDQRNPELDKTVLRFARAVLDKTPSIGVRGDLTAEYLQSIGVPSDSIDIIGCPSLFDHNGDLRIEKRSSQLTTNSAIAMNLTIHWAVEELVNSHVNKYPNLTYVPQEASELAMLLWGTEVSRARPDLPLHKDHELFREDRIRFFLDPVRWREFMNAQEFAFGTRIHGIIAALSAGTPAFLLAGDSRTLELAQYHRIPHRVDLHADAAELYDSANFDEFNSFMKVGFDRYVSFLDRNAVPHIHAPGHSNPEYERQLESTPFPPPVRTFAKEMSVSERELLRKLEWLRQGAAEDKKRWIGGYRPEWRPQ